MEFSNKDFNADKVMKYEEVRKSMSRTFESHPSHFWPVSVNPDALPGEMKTLKDLTRKEHQRIQEKIKELQHWHELSGTG